MKLIYQLVTIIAISLFINLSRTAAQNIELSYYDAQFKLADYSNFNEASGGTIRVPFLLTSGLDITDGEAIWVDYNFSPLSDGLSYQLYDITSWPGATMLGFSILDEWQPESGMSQFPLKLGKVGFE